MRVAVVGSSDLSNYVVRLFAMYEVVSWVPTIYAIVDILVLVMSHLKQRSMFDALVCSPGTRIFSPLPHP